MSSIDKKIKKIGVPCCHHALYPVVGCLATALISGSLNQWVVFRQILTSISITGTSINTSPQCPGPEKPAVRYPHFAGFNLWSTCDISDLQVDRKYHLVTWLAIKYL